MIGVPSFSEEKNSAFTFCLFPSRRKSRKSNTRRNFNAKIVSFEDRRERHKKTKRGKKERHCKTALFFILFFYISSRKERVHNTQQHKHARFREVKRERDDCKWFFFDDVVVFIITRSNFGTTARRRRFSSKEESTFTTTTTTTSSSSSATKENFCFE